MNQLLDRAFGKLLRKKREALHLSQTALCRQMKWPQTKLSRVEQGKRSVDLPELFALSHAFNCSVNQLLSELDAGGGNEKQPVATSSAGLSPSFVAATEDENVLLAHLARYGVRFLGGSLHPVLSTLPLEETVLAALRYMQDPRVFEALPALLLKNATEVDWTKLLSNADALSLQNRLGMVLAAALKLKGLAKHVDPNAWDLVKSAHDRLAERRLDREEVVGSPPRSEATLSFLRQRTPDWLRSWHGVGSGDLESFARYLPR